MVGVMSKFDPARAMRLMLVALCMAAFCGAARAEDKPDAAAAKPDAAKDAKVDPAEAAKKAKVKAREDATTKLKKELADWKTAADAKAGPAGPVKVDIYTYTAPNGLLYVDEAAYDDDLEVQAIYKKYEATTEMPAVVAGKSVNNGDTAWILVSAALVLMMTGPGLALFYSGLVRRKNVLATMMQSFILMAVVSVIWAMVGYSLAFAEGNPFIGGFRFAMLREVGAVPSEYANTIPHQLWMVYQCMFAVITPALICGAYAERMKFSSMLMFSVLWLLFVYCPMAHMVWGKGGLLNAGNGGKILAIDFAGGTVVHIASGVSALICCLVMGKRRGFGKVPMTPHSVVLSVIGAALLWVGWFGFNAGSALAANGLAVNAFCTTHFAAAAATIGWMVAEWLKTGKPTVLGAISGAVAGLVVITPAAGFVTTNSALVMGLIGGVACFFSATALKHALGYDDSLDAFGVHGMGGTIGAILTGVFAVYAINGPAGYAPAPGADGHLGLLDGGPALTAQLIATGLTWVLAAVGAFILLKITDVALGLRVPEAEEYDGLDITQHGERGYNLEEEFGGTVMDGSSGTSIGSATAAATKVSHA